MKLNKMTKEVQDLCAAIRSDIMVYEKKTGFKVLSVAIEHDVNEQPRVTVDVDVPIKKVSP